MTPLFSDKPSSFFIWYANTFFIWYTYFLNLSRPGILNLNDCSSIKMNLIKNCFNSKLLRSIVLNTIFKNGQNREFVQKLNGTCDINMVKKKITNHFKNQCTVLQLQLGKWDTSLFGAHGPDFRFVFELFTDEISWYFNKTWG